MNGHVTLPFVDNSELNLDASLSYRSEIFLDEYDPQGRQGGYSLVNLRAEWNKIAGTGADDTHPPRSISPIDCIRNSH